MLKIRKYALTGETQPLVDSHKRNITLVAIVTTKDITDVLKDVEVKQHGKRRVTTIVENTIIVQTVTTIEFGLAVVSPVDVRAQLEANIAFEAAQAKGDTKLVEELAAKRNIVSPERGANIAFGKAAKAKSALAVITTNNQFFTTHMIKLMLAEKLKHICSDPNRFIRIASPKQEPTASIKPIKAKTERLAVEQQ